jgi:uncharacterized membrane protein YkvA (DUF1232 family)
MVTVRRVAALRALASALWGARKPGAPGIGKQLGAVPRMLAQGLSGNYPNLDKGRIALAGLGLVSVVSPVDLIPELILPLIGLADDALILAWVVGALLSETEAFLAWEQETRLAKGKVVSGQVLE